MAGFNENADKKIKISSKPNAVTIHNRCKIGIFS